MWSPMYSIFNTFRMCSDFQTHQHIKKTGTGYAEGLYGPIRLSLIPLSSRIQERSERYAPIWRTGSPRIMEIRIKRFRSYDLL
jgi:hypothetical protein